MIEQTGQPIKFIAQFTSAKVGKTGLTVNVTVYKPDATSLVTGTATELAKGVYYFNVAGASVTQTGDYIAIFSTNDTSVDQQDMPCEMTVGRAGVNNLDATINSRLASSSYTAPPSAASIAAAVWANGTRSLTTFGTLVADTTTAVWANSVRSLSTFGSLASDVWASGSRSLTEKTGFELSAGALTSIANSVWGSGTRSLTTFGTLVADVTTAVWGAGTRTLSSFGTLVTSIWANASRTLSDKADFTLSTAEKNTIVDLVWDEVVDSGNHNISSSSGQRLTAASAAADPLLNTVPGAYAAGSAGSALGRLATGAVTLSVISPVLQGNALELVQGDDYSSSESREIRFTSDDFPEMVGYLNVKIGFQKVGGGSHVVTGTVTDTTGAGKSVMFELTPSDTNLIATGAYDVQVTLANGHIITLVRGNATVLTDVVEN